MTFGQELAEARAQRGLTQTALAKEIGMKQPYIHLLEADDKAPTLTTLMALTAALNGEIIIRPDGKVRIRLEENNNGKS